MLRGQIDRLKAAGAEESAASPKLLDAEWTVARVLGRQARDYLVSRKMLDAGREQGVADGALAFSAEAMAIDLGADAGLRFGQLVVADDQRSFPAGPTLIGRVEQVSRHCSLLCRTQDDGFRLLVRTARRIEGRLQFGASGLLVGTGEPFCRLRYIPIDEPIAAGDEVFTLEGQGALDQPAYCGRVERIERLPSSGHWDVWVRPPSLATPVDRVAVLRFDLNEQRVASKTSDASGTTAKGAIE
jgi:cell shape-determining protein MreC